MRSLSVGVLIFAACSAQAATVTLSKIYVSVGPNSVTPSPSYPAYTTNAQTGVLAGGVSVGGDIHATPTAYNVLGSGVSVSANSIVGTPFPSWFGVADPGGALANETGNALFWSVVISGTPGLNDINLGQVSVQQSSTDPLASFGDPLNPFTADYSASSYAFDHLGILADGTLVSSGASTNAVNKIVLTSFSALLDPLVLAADLGISFTGSHAQQMKQIDDAFALNLGNFSINTCFYYGTAASTCDSVNVIVPEPAYSELLFVLIAGCLGCVWVRKSYGSRSNRMVGRSL